MAKVVAVTEAITSLSAVESRFGLQRSGASDFFQEWQADLPALDEAEQAALKKLRQRLSYHRGEGDLLEGAVVLLVVAPLLELAGFYDPPFRIKAEASVEIQMDDGEETLRGRIDVLVMQQQLWLMVLESKKTMISARSALPQALAYMMAAPQNRIQSGGQSRGQSRGQSGPPGKGRRDRPLFGLLTNGDDVLFIKLDIGLRQYAISRAFSLYTLLDEAIATLQIMKQLGQSIA